MGKFEELLMGRLSDALGGIFLGYATLHHYTRHKNNIENLEALTEHAMLRLEHEAQQALIDASNNFPGVLGTPASLVMKLGCLQLGGVQLGEYPKPNDALTKEVARLVTTPSEVRDMFQENVYMTNNNRYRTSFVRCQSVYGPIRLPRSFDGRSAMRRRRRLRGLLMPMRFGMH